MKPNIKVTGIAIMGVLISLLLPNIIVSSLSKNMSKTAYVNQVESQTKNNTIAKVEEKDTAVPVKESSDNITTEEVTEEVAEEKVEEKKDEPKQEETKSEPVILAVAEQKAYQDISNEEMASAIANGSFKLEYSASYETNTTRLTKSRGALYYNNHKETYYSERVLPGTSLNIPGRHSNTADGTVRDGEGYIVVAANPAYLSRGSIVKTSLGPAKVYDTGCDSGIIDIYTNW